MRHIFVSALILLSTVVTAAASDRYPKAKRYVNQTGEVMVIGQATQVVAIAKTQKRRLLVRALPPVQIVPVVEVRPVPRVVVVSAQYTPAKSGIFSDINADPANWPSGRSCCVSGQPYFNENPDS